MKANVIGVLWIFIAAVMIRAQLDEDNMSMIEVDAEFACPPENFISPCLCHTMPPMPTVHCSGIRTLKSLHLALGDKFQANPIPYLKILDCQLMGLPSKAFQNITITRLQISNSNLSFVAPDAFDGLESLVILVLNNVRLFDFPSESLSRLPSLMTLSLPGNKLSRLCKEDLRNINGIKYFALRDNRLAHIERGSFPLGLVTLSLSNNHLLTLNRTVRHLPYLEWLFLSDNRLTSIDGELEGLYNLRHLNLANNLLRTLGDSFHDLHNLKVLELQFNSIYDLGDSLRNLVQLQGLNLSQNILFRLSPNIFQDLTLLENLDLSGNHFMSLSGALTPLSNLVSLDLSNNGLHNFSFCEIRTLVNLKVLDLDGNHLYVVSHSPGRTIQTIRLKMLVLSNNQLYSLEDFLVHFPFLELLDVSFNTMARLWSRDFASTPLLEYLNVEGNHFICDIHQMDVLHELETRNVEIEGKPSCSVTPSSL